VVLAHGHRQLGGKIGVVLVWQIVGHSPNLQNFIPAKLSRYTVVIKSCLLTFTAGSYFISAVSFFSCFFTFCNITSPYFF